MTADPHPLPRYGICYVRFLLTYKISISYRYRDILAMSYRYRIEFQKPISLHQYSVCCACSAIDTARSALYGASALHNLPVYLLAFPGTCITPVHMGMVDLGSWLHTKVVNLSADSQPPDYYPCLA